MREEIDLVAPLQSKFFVKQLHARPLETREHDLRYVEKWDANWTICWRIDASCDEREPDAQLLHASDLSNILWQAAALRGHACTVVC